MYVPGSPIFSFLVLHIPRPVPLQLEHQEEEEEEEEEEEVSRCVASFLLFSVSSLSS
jgi:hypothetical protein